MHPIRTAEPIRRACPLYLCRVPAGFPSPADDHKEADLDLNELLITNRTATFFVRACGDSMKDAGILDGDLLVVDRALEPANGRVVIACLDGELTVKRLHKSGSRPYLTPENPAYRPIWIDEGCSFEVWGVVTHAIHKV